MIDWNLRSRSHSCHKCSADFIDGERCNSAVAVFENDVVQTLLAEKIAAYAEDPKKPKPPEYVRLDFCPSCWPGMHGTDWISSWHSPYSAPEPPAPEPLPRETAESLLRKLMEQEDSVENTSVIFILAVMLERKKILIERRVRHAPDGTMIRVYEHKKTGEIMLVTDPDLGIDQLPGVQRRVQALLEPTAPAQTPATDEPGTPEPESGTGAEAPADE